MTAGPQSDDKGPSAAFPRRGPRRPPPKPPPGNGCAGRARARSGPPIGEQGERSVRRESLSPVTREGSMSERRLCRRNESWGEVRKGGKAPLRGAAALAPSAARSTYREYASRAALGRRLAAGPFSSLYPEVP